ncbi:hypothetical protein [Microbacterium suwonense]|uniref:Leucine rich repeat variant domain-containing protein n=1 Tax=Microbacterium suwonense TaxID=683047 RepID=A0ABN6X6G6_9MICO|nr:hypothetical protein [Microbacterium suwonense]BDZ39617.1 hypothetical protein GCM10025863_22310 [Microbacterium suwonense]
MSIQDIELSMAQDPQAPAELLRRIAGINPSLWPTILANPSCPPDVRAHIEAQRTPASADAEKDAVLDPSTDAAVLGRILGQRSDLGALIAMHPNAYPDMLEWIAQYGNPDAQQAVAARRSGIAAGVDSTALAAPPTQTTAPQPAATVSDPVAAMLSTTPPVSDPVTAMLGAAPAASIRSPRSWARLRRSTGPCRRPACRPRWQGSAPAAGRRRVVRSPER